MGQHAYRSCLLNHVTKLCSQYAMVASFNLPADQPFVSALWDVLTDFTGLLLLLCTSRSLHMPFGNGNGI